MRNFALRIRPTMCPTYEVFLGKRMRKIVKDEGHKPKLPRMPAEDVGRKPIPTPEHVLRRRDRVLDLKKAGMANADIAAKLKVRKHLIRNDIRDLRRAGRL